jgi:NTE family protein
MVLSAQWVRWCSTLLVGSLFISTAFAQGVADGSVTPSKKIGLVLSGGGARGGAHLGVLKVLRELGIPIDVIAGTSIGAVIGGLYASGMTIEDIETALDSAKWEQLFLEILPRGTRSFRRKRDDDSFLVKGRPGWNNKELRFPPGLVQGHQFDLLLTRLTLPVAQVDDFDDLRIPFRAVAADLVTGEPVVLGHGNLARALRASLSIPSVIAPLEIDGRLLIDGGIANNLPVNVARQMGADLIIAVDVSSGLLGRDEISSVLDVTNQLVNMLGRRETQALIASLGPNDVFIQPDLGELRASDFEAWLETIPAGYAAADQQRSQLAALGANARSYADFVVDRRLPEQPMPLIDFVEVRNTSKLADSVVESRLGDIQIGRPLDPDALNDAIAKVYGLELFENIDYTLTERDGETGLVIDAREKSWGPNYLQAGIAYSSTGSADSRFTLAGSFLATTLNRWGGEWRSTLAIGDEPGFVTDFYQPFGLESRFFVQTALRFQELLFNTFSNGERLTEAQIRTTQLELAVGREIDNWGEVRVGLRRGQADQEIVVGEPGPPGASDFDRGDLYARFSVDTLDSVYFPRTGAFLTTEWLTSRKNLGADDKFNQFSFSLGAAKTWGRHTLFGGVRYNSTVSGVAPLQSQFRIGGFFEIGGLNENELTGQHSGRILASYYRRISDVVYLPAYAGITLEMGNAWQNRADISLSNAIAGGTLWVGADTPIGPVYLAYGRAETDDDAFYLFLGPIF